MPPQLLRGALLIVLSEFLITAMSAVIKAVSTDLPTEMTVFFRNLFGLMALIPLIAHRGLPHLKTRVFHLHLMRGLMGVSAMYCYFYSIAHLPLAEATIYKLTAPLFIPLIAWFWLREQVPALARWAALVGFAGVLLILRPGAASFTVAALIGLAGAVFSADAKVTIRRMATSEPSTRIVFYMGVVTTTASALPLPWVWQTPSLVELGWLAAIGALATAAQLLLTRAYALAPAGQIGPLTYVAVIFGAVFGWLFWDEGLGWLTVIGMALVVIAGILATRPDKSRPALGLHSAAVHPNAQEARP